MYDTDEPDLDQRGLLLPDPSLIEPPPPPPILLRLLPSLDDEYVDGEYELYERLLLKLPLCRHAGQAASALADRCPRTGAVHLVIFQFSYFYSSVNLLVSCSLGH